MDRTPNPRFASRAATVGIVLLYLFLSFITFNQIEEDAFIYFRIAANIADGYGFVFNRGGEPIEAGSSVLWQLLLALLYELPIPLVLSAKAAGIFFGVAILLLVQRLTRLHVAAPSLRYAPPLLLAVSTPFVMSNQRGLETALYALLIVWLVLCLSDDRLRRYWILPAILILPARPEGFFVLTALLPVCFLRRFTGMRTGTGIAVLAAFGLLMLSARFFYFHDLVPSPFYTKLHPQGFVGWKRVHGLFLWNFIYLFSISLLFTLRSRSFWNDQRLIALFFIAVITVWSGIAQDYMPYNRHMVPALALLYVLIAAGFDSLLAGRRNQHVLGAAACAICVVATLFFSQSARYFNLGYDNPIRSSIGQLIKSPPPFLRATLEKIGNPMKKGDLDGPAETRGTIGTNFHVLVGEFIRLNYPQKTTVIYDQMGQTPYYAGFDKPFIDTLGLTDREIGYYYLKRRRTLLARVYSGLLERLRRHFFSERPGAANERQALDRIFEHDPDLILVHGYTALTNRAFLSNAIRRDPRFRREYTLRYTLNRWIRVHERRRTPLRTPEIPDGLSVVHHSEGSLLGLRRGDRCTARAEPALRARVGGCAMRTFLRAVHWCARRTLRAVHWCARRTLRAVALPWSSAIRNRRAQTM